MRRKRRPGERAYCGGQHSICWRCRRSNADEDINPLGYCSWVAVERLPDGCVVVPAGKMLSGERLYLVMVCPLFEAEDE